MIVDDIKAHKVIMDASVVIKWFIEESGTIAAREILKQLLRSLIEVSAPNLLVHEVANVLWKSKKFNRYEIGEAIETIYNSPIQLFALDKLLALSTVHFMATYDLTSYDASYAALAHVLQVPLLTADVKDFKKIKEIEVVEL